MRSVLFAAFFAGLVLVLGLGCATMPDSDGDGIADNLDACPDLHAGEGGGEYAGCPPPDRPAAVDRGPRPCSSDRDCAVGERCVEDCDAEVSGVSRWIAQAAGCPSVCVRASLAVGAHEADADEDEDEEDLDAEIARRVAERERASTFHPMHVPSTETTTSAPSGALLGPIETVKKGDGKVVAALKDAVALMDDLNAAIRAASGCAARVQALERWGAANRARASRVNHRVAHLTAYLNYDYLPAEKDLIRKQEEGYEEMGRLLLERCAEDGPEMKRLEDLDVDLRHTFHRNPAREPLDDVKCAQLQELRDRAMLAPESLIGERKPDGSHLSTIQLQSFACFVNGAEWRSGSSDLVVACVDFGRSDEQMVTHPILGTPTDMWASRTQYLTKLLDECLTVTAWGQYEVKDKTLEQVTLAAKDHTVRGRDVADQDGRYMISLIRPR